MVNKDLELLISLTADTSGATKTVQSLRLVEDALKQSGVAYDKNATVVGKSVTEFERAGKAFDRFSGVLLNTNGTVSSFNNVYKKTGDVLQSKAGSLTFTTTAFKQMANAASLAGINIAKLGTRVAASILIAQTFGAAIRGVTGSVRDAVKFMVDFEFALAQVQIVGNSTDKQLATLGKGVLDLAQRFGVSFEDAGNAMGLLAQQGFNTTEILQLLNPVIQLSLTSGRGLADVVEDLTAVTKSYNLEASKAIDVVDKITKVQLNYAIGTGDLVAGLRRLTPVTSQLGVSLEETIGFITAVQTQTRKGGAGVGDSLRTIFTRLQEGSASAVQSIGQVPIYLDELGQATFDVSARQRDLTDVIGDLAARWDTLTTTQKSNLAVTVAGRFRVTEFLALMNNYNEQIRATADAYFSQGAALQASGILTDTLKNKVEQLNVRWKEFVNIFAPATLSVGKTFFDVLNASVKGLSISVLTMIGDFKSLNQLLDADKKFKEDTAIAQQLSSVEALIEARKKLEKETIRINRAIAAEQAKAGGGDTQVIENLRAQAQEFASVYSRELNAFSGLTNQVFTSADSLQTILEKLTKSDVDIFKEKVIAEQKVRVKALSDEIKNQIDLIDDLNKKKSENRGSATASALVGGNTDQALSKNNAIETQLEIAKGKQAELNKQLQDANNIINDKAKIEQLANKQLDERINSEKRVQSIEENKKSILDKIEKLQSSLTSQGKSEIAIKRETLKLLEKSALIENGLIVDDQLRGQQLKLKGELDLYDIQKLQAEFQSEQNIAVSEALALGKNEIEVQQLRITYAKEMAQITGDEKILLEEQLKLRELIAEKQAQISQEFKNSVRDSFKDLIKGESDLNQFFDSIGAKINDRFAQAVSTALTDKVFKETGIGDIFGDLIFGTENIFNDKNPAKQGLTEGAETVKQKILEAAREHASLVALAITGKGKAGSINSLSNLSSTLSPQSQNLLNSVLPKGIANALKSASSGNLIASGSSLKGLATNLENLISGASASKSSGGAGLLGSLGGLAGGALSKGFSAIPYVGAIAGIGFSLFNLFKGFRTKRTVQVQESEKEFQVASKIDVTNKKLDVVNRNLIALKQTFEVFVLPTSAAFAEKRSLEDNFSLNARRGLA